MTVRRSLWQLVVLGVVVTLALSVYAELGPLRRAFQTFEWWALPLVLGLTLGNQAVRFLKWEYLLGEIQVDLPLSTSFYVFGSGLLMIMTPGKLGEVWKSWLIRDVDGTPVNRTLPVVATERITDLLGVASISVLGVVAFDPSPVLLVALTLPLLAGIALLQYERGCHWLLDRFEGVPLIGRKTGGLRQLYDSSRDLLRPRPLAVTTFLSICSWGLECVGMWLVIRGFDAEVTLLVAAFVFCISSIAGALSLLPGGVGVAEGSMTGLLLVFGLDRATAVSATLITRAATLWFVTALAGLVYLVFRWRYTLDFQALEGGT